MTGEPRDYDDIPGTYVYDSRYARMGYALNQFCKSLDIESNRTAFLADEAGYLAGYPLTEEQHAAVLDRDWLGLLRLGGNIYYTFKLARLEGKSVQYVGGQMSGMTEEEFKKMMDEGGRRA